MTNAQQALDTGFFGHPRGLSTLFFTEWGERLAYYGLRAILIFYLTAPVEQGGLGFTVSKAGAIYGMFTAMAYLAAMPGGWIADRILGQRRAVLLGGIIIALGDFLLAVPSIPVFYLGLAIAVVGTGLLKPNVSTIVGHLYAPGDPRRDSGFSIFYMGINLGSVTGALVCGYIGENINYRLGFAFAGIGMLLGVLQYVLSQRRLGDAGMHPVSRDGAHHFKRTALIAAAAIVLFVVLNWTGVLNVDAEQLVNFAGIVLFLTVVIFFGWLLTAAHWTPVERKRLFAIAALFVASALFWSAFEQAGSTLSLFAQRQTDNHLFGFAFPASWYQTLNGAFIIVFAPVFAWIWLRLGPRDPSPPAKFAIALVIVGVSFLIIMAGAIRNQTHGLVTPWYLIVMYLLHTFGELSLSPVGLSASTKLAPPSVGGLMMGVWFMSISTGNYIGGRLASFYGSLPLPTLFGFVAAFAIGAGLILFLFVKPIVRLSGGVR